VFGASGKHFDEQASSSGPPEEVSVSFGGRLKDHRPRVALLLATSRALGVETRDDEAHAGVLVFVPGQATVRRLGEFLQREARDDTASGHSGFGHADPSRRVRTLSMV
jgi:hypothetical protein